MKLTSDFAQKLFILWRQAVDSCEKGNKDIDSYFNESDLNFLKSNGLTAQDIYDYAEDFVKYREPDFAEVLLMEEIRRAYFLEEQKGVALKELTKKSFPNWSEKLEGVECLPRIIEKAWGKLHGDLPGDIMYYCLKTRVCLKENNIHPAELMRAVWFFEKNPDQKGGLVKWIMHRRNKRSGFWGNFKKIVSLK